jgi:two-component system response regulator
MRSMPVVMLTTSREGRDVEAAYRAGANSYVRKPVDFEDFIRAMGQVGLYWLLLNVPPETL